MDEPLTSRDKAVAYALIALLVILEVVGVGTYRGYPPPQVWTLMQAGLVLLSSLAFYLLTRGSKGELTRKDLGIRLGGPAAVGLVIVIVLHGLQPEAGCKVRVLDVPGHGPGDVLQVYKHAGLIAGRVLADQRILVEFDEGKSEAWIVLRKPDARAEGWEYTRYAFSRSGEVQPARVDKGEVDSW